MNQSVWLLWATMPDVDGCIDEYWDKDAEMMVIDRVVAACDDKLIALTIETAVAPSVINTRLVEIPLNTIVGRLAK